MYYLGASEGILSDSGFQRFSSVHNMNLLPGDCHPVFTVLVVGKVY